MEFEQVLMRAFPDCAAQFLADSETLPYCHGLYGAGEACRCGASGWIVH